MAERAQIAVTGIVQGVGFRPYVYTLATGHGLTGYVTNTASGVLIEVEGPSLADFIRRLPAEAPPLSRIDSISVIPLPLQGTSGFTIQTSRDLVGSAAFTHISPDISICSECHRELNDPSDRRFRYPFINCTNCGPRYTITKAIPYDRPNTTMAIFELCPACSREYHDPSNRRFHAQPNACPECGPRCSFKPQDPKITSEEQDPILTAIAVLRQGGIMAIKGLGGFHIACDALNDKAVRTLRQRKRKSNKPFAVMASSLEVIRRYCEVSPEEQTLLESPKRPVVLLRKKVLPDGTLSSSVSPNNHYVGCMLPYTPLHYLLFESPPGQIGSTQEVLSVLVMTSGNMSEEPIVHTNKDAERKLAGLVDGFLFHDRDIFMRVDDSVVRVPGSHFSARSNGAQKTSSMLRITFIRRARGFAPEAIPLPAGGPDVLGCGADLKNTFTLMKGSFAIPSQHIGDMENYETMKFFEESVANLRKVYRVDPVAIAHDLHPGYLSTRWAKEAAARGRKQGSGQTIELVAIQHHYAHIGSVMAEHGLNGPVIGVAFDGTGYGTDGNLWGGEFLIAGIDGFERVGQLKYMPLPGGETAIREPWRTAVSYLMDARGADQRDILQSIGLTARHGQKAVDQVCKVAKAKDLSPLSSGAGRLFDAVSAMLGICDVNTFEGEAAMALESLVMEGENSEYPVVFTKNSGYTVVDFSSALNALIADLQRQEPKERIATRFHNTVAVAIRSVVNDVRQQTGVSDVVLSGGTFQNLYLLSCIRLLLKNDGLGVYTNEQMPPNDACISLGQAYLVRERLKRGMQQ
jgi:hydrogenase maturation protein HypF